MKLMMDSRNILHGKIMCQSELLQFLHWKQFLYLNDSKNQKSEDRKCMKFKYYGQLGTK